MSTSYQSSLEIGGVIKPKRLTELWNLVKAQGIGPDWSDEFDNRAHFDRFVDDRDSTLMLTCNTANLDTYADIKQFCMKHKLSYYHREDAVAEGGESVEWWSPGMKESQTGWGHEGRAVVLVEDLVKCKKLRDYVDLVARYTPPEMPDFRVDE